MRKLRKCLVQCLLAQADVFKQLVLFNQQTKKQKKSTIYYHKRQWKTENPHNGEAEKGMFGIFCLKIEIADGKDNMKQVDERLRNLLLCSNTHLRTHLQQHCCSSKHKSTLTQTVLLPLKYSISKEAYLVILSGLMIVLSGSQPWCLHKAKTRHGLMGPHAVPIRWDGAF